MDDYEELGALARAFIYFADHRPNCVGGDGNSCWCGYLQAWHDAQKALDIARRLADQHGCTASVVD